jgi:hypothetical protein
MTKEDMRVEIDAILDASHGLYHRLYAVRDELHNRPPVMRGEHTSVTVDESVIEAVIRMHEENPEMPQHEIAKRVGVNPGRVSEILAGKRT